MENIIIQKSELKAVVQESVKEAFKQEFAKLRASLLPFAGKAEQKDIEKRYGKPVRKIAKDIEIEI